MFWLGEGVGRGEIELSIRLLNFWILTSLFVGVVLGLYQSAEIFADLVLAGT